MKLLLYLALIGAAAYGVAHYVPAETRTNGLAAVGLADFFQETLPTYLRSKLTIPENPVEKRQRLLNELSAAIGNIETELEAVAPSASTDSRQTAVAPGQATKTPSTKPPASPPSASSGQAQTAKPITQSELRKRVEKTKELLNQSETVLEELERANPQQGFIAKATERILDKILPPPPSMSSGQAPAAAAADGIGGDASGNPLCPQ